MPIPDPLCPLLPTFRRIAREFEDIADTEICEWITETHLYVSRSTFRQLYDQAVVYLTAHRLKLIQMAEEEAAGSQQVSSISEGGASRSFVSDTVNPATDYASLKLTKYGQHFLSMRQAWVR